MGSLKCSFIYTLTLKKNTIEKQKITTQKLTDKNARRLVLGKFLCLMIVLSVFCCRFTLKKRVIDGILWVLKHNQI